MKTLEDLKTAYQQVIKDKLCCVPFEDLTGVLQADILDLEEDRCDILKALRFDWKNKRLDQFKQLFSAFSGVDYDLSFYDIDIKLLEEELDMNLSFIRYYQQLQENLREENSCDVLILEDFTARCYQKNLARLETLRDMNSYRAQGIVYQDFQLEEDTKEVFDLFFQEQIANISTKSVVYKKKM